MELSIKTEHFTSKFLYINLNNNNSSFYPILYRTPTLCLTNLLFETPWMDAPFGICQYNNEKDKNEGKYHLDLSFNGYIYDVEIKNFYRVITNIDNFIINFIDNYQDCLGITKKGNYKYNNQIRYNKNNPKYPPTIKLKIFEQNTKIVDLYGKDVNNFNEYIQPNSKVQALIRCNGLWSYENKWGVSWKVCKLVVKNPDILPELAFIDNFNKKEKEKEKEKGNGLELESDLESEKESGSDLETDST
jgi:hypothetical protein